MADITEKASRDLTMKDFFREENGEIVPVHEVVELGQRIEALVLQKEDADGRLILSAKRAAFERAWNRIEDAYNERRTVEGPVIEVVKGGLILDIGLRGFLPASLVDIRRVRNLEAFLGQK